MKKATVYLFERIRKCWTCWVIEYRFAFSELPMRSPINNHCSCNLIKNSMSENSTLISGKLNGRLVLLHYIFVCTKFTSIEFFNVLQWYSCVTNRSSTLPCFTEPLPTQDGAAEWKAQGQFGLIRAQQEDKINLDRELLSSEREALSNLIIRHDNKKQKLLQDMDAKLAFKMQGDLSEEEVRSIKKENFPPIVVFHPHNCSPFSHRRWMLCLPSTKRKLGMRWVLWVVNELGRLMIWKSNLLLVEEKERSSWNESMTNNARLPEWEVSVKWCGTAAACISCEYHGFLLFQNSTFFVKHQIF